MRYMYLIIPFTTLVLCQIVKFIVELIVSKKINVNRIFNGMGGMPSSHSAFTFSLAFTIGFNNGFDSVLFATSLIFAIIVAYDAMNLRMEVERHAITLNSINKKHPDLEIKKLKEQIGHKKLEVLVGILFGLFVSYIFYMFI